VLCVSTAAPAGSQSTTPSAVLGSRHRSFVTFCDD
jgi:hypothetical protein